MAVAKKCDICGAYYDPYNWKEFDPPNGFMYLNIDNEGDYEKGEPYDCCPNCMDRIENFIKDIKSVMSVTEDSD